jgi:hypothetical protein
MLEEYFVLKKQKTEHNNKGKNREHQPGLVGHSCNASTWEVEAGGRQV